MELSTEQLDNGIKRIILKGHMDILGTGQIDVRLAAETATEKAFVVLDLSQVDFLASVGIGVLVRSTKALRLLGGDAVIISTVPIVTTVLEMTLITQVIKVFKDLESACQGLLQSMQNQAGGGLT